MAIRTNAAFYNNPQIGVAFANLAEAFKPPSGSDVAGYAQAELTRQKARGLTEAMDMARAATFNRDAFDRVNSALGNYNPTQGFGARDMESADRRYGYDQSLAGTKYSADRTFEASRANNTENNSRQIVEAAMTPVAAGATRFVPPAVQSALGIGATQVGTLSANEGETVIAPDGRSLMGKPKALTDDQVRGAVMQDLRRTGELTDRNLADIIMGKEAPVQAVGPDGKVQFMTPGEAVRTRAQPAVDVTKQGEAAGKIRGEIAQLPSYKNYAQAAPIYSSMLETAGRDTKASDLNLVYGLGKIMDPGSVVREGEMVMVKNTSALPDWLQGAIAQLNGGAALTPDTRAALMREAHSRMTSYEDIYARDLDRYAGIVDRAGLSRSDVLPSFQRSKQFELPTKPQAAQAPLPGAAAATPSAPVKVSTPAEAAKLPPGTPIILPDGSQGVVPQRPQARPAPRAAGASGGW